MSAVVIIPSPCVRVCIVENNHCIGCTRSEDEIKNWKDLDIFDNEIRLKIFNRCMKNMSDQNKIIAQRKMDLWEEHKK